MAEVGKALYWAPRILGIVITLMVFCSSFDIFGGNQTIGEIIGDLILHLIPSFILIGLLYYSWKKNEMIGGLIYIGLGVLYSIWVIAGIPVRELYWIAIIALPAFITGGLFIENWRRKRSK